MDLYELGKCVVEARLSRHTVDDRVAAIEAKKPQLKSVAESAGGKLRILVFKNERRLEVYAPDWKSPRLNRTGAHTPCLANGLVYVVARQGDTMQGIADEFETTRRRLVRYNDLYNTYVPNKGDIIYLHRKNARAKKPYTEHVVRDGESMYMIAQMYGIRLSRLYKMNKEKGDVFSYSPVVGDVIRLR